MLVAEFADVFLSMEQEENTKGSKTAVEKGIIKVLFIVPRFLADLTWSASLLTRRSEETASSENLSLPQIWLRFRRVRRNAG